MASDPRLLRSAAMTRGLQRTTHRALPYSMGLRPEDLERPLIGVVNSFNELVPEHAHLQPLCQAVKLGIAAPPGSLLERNPRMVGPANRGCALA